MGILPGHDGGVVSVAWSPDGTRLATGALDGMVRLWTSLGTPGPQVQGQHGNAVSGLAWSPDSTRLASASLDGSVRLWIVNDGGLGPILEHPGGVRALSWSSDGLRLATACDDRTIRLWNVADDGTPGPVIKVPGTLLHALAFSLDGRRLAAGGDDQLVRFWNLDDPGKPLAGPVLKGHAGPIRTLAFSPDRRQLATAGDRDAIRLWSIDAGRDPRPATVPTLGSPGAYSALAWSPDGRRLTAAIGRHLMTISPGNQRGASFAAYPPIIKVAVRGDGQRIATGFARGPSVLLWGPDGKPRALLSPPDSSAVTSSSLSLAWNPEGSQLAVAGFDQAVRIWTAEGAPDWS